MTDLLPSTARKSPEPSASAFIKSRLLPYGTVLLLVLAGLILAGEHAHLFGPDAGVVLLVVLYVVLAGGSIMHNARLLEEIEKTNAGREEEARRSETEAHSAELRRLRDLALANEQLTNMAKELEIARDQALEIARNRSHFLAHISHEIRTPLNAVVGMAELLNRTKLSNDQQELAGLIASSGETLLSVINDILNYSKIESGQFTLELAEFDLAQLVEGAAQLLSEQSRLKEVTLTTFVSPTLPRSYLADPSRVRQVLVNLLGNSIRFANKGEIFISAVADPKDKTRVRFSIKDHGSDISTSIIASLFAPPTEVNIFTARKYGGTGLGLSVTKKLVEVMQGEMGVESDEGKGSTFWFSIPLMPAPPSENAAETESLKMPREKRKIMLVGKATSLVAVILAYTRSWALECEYQPSPETALSALKNNPTDFQCVIVDSALGSNDAITFLTQLFCYEELAELHTVLLCDNDEREQSARKLGVSIHTLRKPFKKVELREVLRQCQLSIRRTGEIVRPEAELKSFLASMNFNDPANTKLEEAKTPQTQKDQGRILVVEDNPVNRRLVHLQLKQLGFACDIVENGQEAVESLRANQYDLVFMDCWMPVLDGFSATAKIREDEAAAHRHTTIVAMTANALDSDRQECLDAGMDDYISKPVTQNALKTVIEKWLSKRQLHFGPS